MRFIETAKLSGLDQTGLCWSQRVLSSLRSTTIKTVFICLHRARKPSLSIYHSVFLLRLLPIYWWGHWSPKCPRVPAGLLLHVGL